MQLLLPPFRTAVVYLIILTALLPATAAVADQLEAPKCHDARQAASFPKGPARKMHGIGNSHFAVATVSQEAQNFFDQGINLLHSFWNFEALRAFREAERLDPDMPMAAWGIAMACAKVEGPAFTQERNRALKKIEDRLAQASVHEQLYLKAVLAKYAGDSDRSRQLMEQLMFEFPDDVEAKLFFAISQMDGYDSERRPRAGQQRSIGILRNLIASHPQMSAVNHYWIHALEGGEHVKEALLSAEKLPALAPKSAHLVHMPGHVYYLLGRYEDAYNAFVQSEQIDREYMTQTGVSATDDWNYLHNLDFLLFAAGETGRLSEGGRWAEIMMGLALQTEHSRSTDAGRPRLNFEGQTASARLAWRFERWDKAAREIQRVLRKHSSQPAEVEAYLEGLLAYFEAQRRLSKRLSSPDLTPIARNTDQIELAVATLNRARADSALEGDQWKLPFIKSAEAVLRIAGAELRARLFEAQGDRAKAITWYEESAAREQNAGYREPPLYPRPVREAFGNFYLRSGEPERALEQFELALKRRITGFSLLGKLHALQKIGSHETAIVDIRQALRAIWKDPILIPGS